MPALPPFAGNLTLITLNRTSPLPLPPIQMLWIGGVLSRLEVMCLRSFVAQGHPVLLYTYDASINAPVGVQLMDASEVVSADLVPRPNTQAFTVGSPSSFSNYFRYHLLYARGGWWADCDVVALKPWVGFPSVVIASTRELDYGIIANTYAMHFPPGHDIMRACLDALGDEDPRKLEFGTTGPLLVNKILGPDGVRTHSQSPSVFGPVPWNASEQFVRPLWKRFTLSEWNQRLRYSHLSCSFTKKTVAVHLWNATWRANGRDKNRHYARSCLYEKLQRRFNP